MTNDMKYPEEIRQDEMLRNLERLEAKLKRRREEGKPVIPIKVETSIEAPKDKVFFMNDNNLYVSDKPGEWEKLNEEILDEYEKLMPEKLVVYYSENKRNAK